MKQVSESVDAHRPRPHDAPVMKHRAAVGAIAGGVQKILNRATRMLIYEFRIAGTVAKPRISAVRTAFLSDLAANSFGRVLARRSRSI